MDLLVEVHFGYPPAHLLESEEIYSSIELAFKTPQFQFLIHSTRREYDGVFFDKQQAIDPILMGFESYRILEGSYTRRRSSIIGVSIGNDFFLLVKDSCFEIVYFAFDGFLDCEDLMVLFHSILAKQFSQIDHLH